MNGSEVIYAILANEGIKAGTFAKRIEVTPTQIYDLRDGKIKSVSDKIADKILTVYPKYNKSWLMTGIGEMLAPQQPEKKKVKVDLSELLKARQGMESAPQWAKLGEAVKKSRRGMVERIRVAMPEAKNVRPSIIFQHLAETKPTLALWAATGKDDKVVMSKIEYEAMTGQIKALKMLNESLSKENEAIRTRTEENGELLSLK